MTSSSVALGLAAILTLFVPQEILAAVDLPITNPLPILIQLVGALYFALAFMNWMAKDLTIGGIYGRPIAIGNFAHFFIGALILGNYQISNGINGLILAALAVYAIFAILFWWLVFQSSGLPMSRGKLAQKSA